jgi:hypothetical protein
MFACTSKNAADWNPYVPNTWGGDYNYGYLIVDDLSKHMLAVDPAGDVLL